jgi:hypothetical protein
MLIIVQEKVKNLPVAGIFLRYDLINMGKMRAFAAIPVRIAVSAAFSRRK